MSCKQKTLRKPIEFSGRGLHTSANVTMKISPAEADKGIVFRRIDVGEGVEIPALSDYVTDTSRGTTIEKNGVKISTIEHIMSSLWSMGVDNAIIEINGPEVPIMDGSACEYAPAIEEAGLLELDAERVYLTVPQKVSFTIPEKNVEITIYPDENFEVDVHVDYDSKVIGNQYATYSEGDDFKKEIAPCRTFVFLHEIEPLLKLNLIKGGDLDNAIVVVENPISNEEVERLSKIFNKQEVKINEGYINNLKLRYTNEIARHKLLDVLGDFALLGVRIKGRISAIRPGHYANTEAVKLLKKMMTYNLF